MADINESIGNQNLGGANTVQFTSVLNSPSIPEATGHKITEANISLGSGQWNTFYATPGSINVDVNEKEGDAGTVWEVKITLRYPKDQAAATNTFLSMKNEPQIVKVTDNNLVKTLFGNLNTPMRMRFSILRPGEVAGYNGYQVEFYGTLLYPPYYLV
ncbi:MAG: hypothetical protein ACQER7_06250 [Bacteroidota bacterium]